MKEYADDSLWREKRMEEILFSDAEPVRKVQDLIRIGLDDETAEEVVRRYQLGQHEPTHYEPAYYERLDFEDEYKE
jgi:hypothetical protein